MARFTDGAGMSIFPRTISAKAFSAKTGFMATLWERPRWVLPYGIKLSLPFIRWFHIYINHQGHT